MLKLYHLSNSRSQRIVWLLEVLQLDYKLIFCERTHNGEAPTWLKDIHPLGKVPILVDDTHSPPQVLAETSAILESLLANKQPHQLQPVDSANQQQYFYWKNFADATLMPNLALKQIFSRMVDRSPFFARPLIKIIKRAFDQQFLNPALYQQMTLIEQHLATHTWFAGEKFSAADIMMVFLVEALLDLIPDNTQFSATFNYMQQVQSLDSFQAAQIKGHWNSNEHQVYWSKTWA
ncbi:glutathione S-transferase family protein [Acinetobacter vivianii]|uniref:glutathione S-transferase family protein n=1 Tax=Acinetobacter vivianii TaxID=1776742 RepID=UPI002DBD96EA|nr:glutathione S-transferase [Acinetobacter vivianii]MEB6480767.1 glutathione S-transferase [Acinetobacter vivianii]MEB6659051.1 glutathione S-transferase [Acinetobacter vivianii]